MKKQLFILMTALLMATTSCAQCYKPVPCEMWPDEPLLSAHVDGADVLLAAIMPDDVSKFVVYWGDRYFDTYEQPLPVVVGHEYIRTGTVYKIRVRTYDVNGNSSGAYILDGVSIE